MSNYTPITDFGAKDALSTGNPSKLILGTEVDAEFDAIATAVATKVDSITSLSAETAIAAADVLAFYDDSAGSHKKITSTNLGLSLNKVLKIQAYTEDAGSSTSSTSYANLSNSVKSFTPVSASSTIVLFVSFKATSSNVASQNNIATYQMYETSTAGGIGNEPTLAAPSAAGGVGAQAPSCIIHSLASTGTSARTFGLMGKGSHGTITATGHKWIIAEIA